jgi:hypothetical protein
MPAAFASAVTQAKVSPRFLPFIDRLLVTGLKLGDAGKHEAINKVLKLVPEWKRGDCWRRIRRLRRALPTGGNGTCRRHVQQPISQPCEFHNRSAARPWTTEEDAKLLDWVGYEPVSKIALRLNRSVRAVRFRLGALGMSAKVSDGWSQRALSKLLHMSAGKFRRLVGNRILRVRDPRITTRSLLKFCTSQGARFNQSTVERVRPGSSKYEAYSWDRVSNMLSFSADDVGALVAKGTLKILDPFVTDRSFEEFCAKHSDEINLSLIDAATVKWLSEEYGVVDNATPHSIPHAQKHALVVRRCKCGRSIAGNVFFKHVKHCEGAKGQAMNAAA